MKSKRWLFWVGIGLVIVLVFAAFSFANFRAMSSKLVKESNMATSTGSVEEFQPINADQTGLVVTGENRLAPALQKEMANRLQGKPQFGQIEILTSVPDKSAYPILVIEITGKDIFWSPVAARARLNLAISYATDGDVSFRLNHPVEFNNTSAQSVLKQSGQYTLTDSSWGIISSPGYFDYLARELTDSIVTDLAGQAE